MLAPPLIGIEKKNIGLGTWSRGRKLEKQDSRRTTTAMGRPSRGRQRIEIRHIEDGGRLQVTFSKRKSGLQKKASELFLLCGSPVAIVIFSPGKKVFALGTPSVDHVLRRYAPIPGEEEEDGLLPVLQDTDDVSAITDRVEVEGIVRRTEETKARSVMEKARMDAIGKTVRQTAAKAGRKFWWEADSGKLGEAELPEFAKVLRRLRVNLQRHLDSLSASTRQLQ
ncbi:uncharacterized LOC100273746 [Zea mays]|jgi:pheromone receptor transcription factor|uniref:MADS transcription factor n=2 Tax=Zea mays TaxID=4577 RepID=B4FXA4_MAIZE|eukprot:NP_001141627.2 uncharacterized protein LOC100273746 [Zea mays]